MGRMKELLDQRLEERKYEMWQLLIEVKGILNTHYGHHCFTDGHQERLSLCLRQTSKLLKEIESCRLDGQ